MIMEFELVLQSDSSDIYSRLMFFQYLVSEPKTMSEQCVNFCGKEDVNKSLAPQAPLI